MSKSAVKEVPSPTGNLSEFARDPAKMLEAAEAALFRLAGLGDGPSAVYQMTSDEKQLFASLQWAPHRVENELARVRQVIALQPVAGTGSDLEAAEETIARARKALAAHDRQRETMRGDLEEAEEILANRQAARKRLRALAPQHVLDEHRQAMRRFDQTRSQSDHRALESRIHWMENVVARPFIEPGDAKEISTAEWLKSACRRGGEIPVGHPATVVFETRGTVGSYVVSAGAYKQLQDECAAELRTLETANPLDVLKNEINSMLDVYLH